MSRCREKFDQPGQLQRPTHGPKSDELFGHPKGLIFLFGSEMWERFSYYGMRALLVLYMVNYLLKPERFDQVIGLSQLKRCLEVLNGPLEAQPFASQIYGLYTSLVYLTAILGGMLADYWLGRTRTVALGAASMVLGHFMMAFEPLFLIAMLLLVLGNGAFKPNISTQVGELYAAGDARRDRAYSIFYVGINLGAFFSPLICGTLGEIVGWHYGFASAGVGMAIGLATYLIGLPRLPKETTGRARILPGEGKTFEFQRAAFGILLLFLPSALFWAAFEQQGNTIALWAERFTDRNVNFFGWAFEIPVTWFQAFNPLMIFLLTPPLVAWWTSRARSGRELSTIRKLSAGCLGVVFSYAIMALAAWTGGGERTSWLWLLAYFIVITVAELYFSPITLSLISRIAPDGSRSVLMGFWFTSIFLGNLIAGWIGGLWSTLSTVNFFLLVAATATLAACIIQAARRPLEKLIGQ